MKTNQQFVRRLERLEQQFSSRQRVQLVWVTEHPEAGRTLAPGERIVLDDYGQCGGVILARERITTDPLDNGQPCPSAQDG